MRVVKLFIFISVFFSAHFSEMNAQTCNCTEYIYLNDVSSGGKVHKFAVNSDGSVTEVIKNGDAWYPGGGVSQMPSPHGLGSDLNGNLYIAEFFNAPAPIRK